VGSVVLIVVDYPDTVVLIVNRSEGFKVSGWEEGRVWSGNICGDEYGDQN
jgi:hypothetical protein